MFRGGDGRDTKLGILGHLSIVYHRGVYFFAVFLLSTKRTLLFTVFVFGSSQYMRDHYLNSTHLEGHT